MVFVVKSLDKQNGISKIKKDSKEKQKEIVRSRIKGQKKTRHVVTGPTRNREGLKVRSLRYKVELRFS